MNAWLMSAGLLIVLIGAVHSVLGETRIFRHLRQSGLVPTKGEPLLREYQLRTVWASWHLVTLLVWTLAALAHLAKRNQVNPQPVNGWWWGSSSAA